MNYKTFYKYLTLLVFSFYSIAAFSQDLLSMPTGRQHKADSLLNALKYSKQDTVKIKLLIKIGKVYENSLPDSALYYYNTALSASIIANRKKDIAKCLFFIGAVYYDQGDYSKAMTYYLKSLKIFEIAGDMEGVADSYINIGMINSDQGIYDKAIEYYSKSLKIFEGLRDMGGVSACYINIGNVHLGMDVYDKAMVYFLKSLKIKVELKDKKGIAICYIGIGNVHFMLSSYDKAKEYYLKSLNIEKETGNKYKIANCYNSIGSVYFKQGAYNKAMEYYMESLKINEEIGNKNGMGTCYDNIGSTYIKQEAYNKTMEYYIKSLKIKKKTGNKNGLSLTFSNIAYLNIKLKKHNEAIEYAHKGLDIAKKTETLLLQSDGYEILSAAYDSLHNYKKSLEYYKLFKQINDSIFNEQSSKQIAEMQTKYETEKKEKENELLVKKNEIQQLQINKATMRQRIVFLIFGATLILIIVISYFLYNRAKLKQKAQFKKQLAEQQKQRFRYVMEAQENDRKRIAQDLHDSLGQLLSTARINVSELKEDIKGEDMTLIWKNSLSLIDEAATEARNISHNLMPNSLIKYGLEPALKDLVNKINITGKVNVFLNIEGINERLNESTEIALFRIIQEMLNNNLKHSEATEIKINLKNENNTISLEIDDNGKGFDTSKIAESTGIGWKNIYSRTELLNGKVTVNSESGKGTKLNIVFAD